ncbi:MAG: 4Fe-4S binding protein [Clostridia bacterium]|nr:4Fe-4S binding protein [Clostridia bacterium]
MNRLKVTLLNKEFKNPLLPASGPTVGSLHSLKFFNENQVGGIVTKTIRIEGAEVHKPCIVEKNKIIHNTELWSELPLKKWVDDILPNLKKELKKPLIVCAGYTSDDFKISIPQLKEYADFFEVSTHYGKDGLKELVSTITSLTDVPVFVKLSPHIQDYLSFIAIAIENGAKGIVAMNSLGPGAVIDLNKKSVTIGVNEGQSWISGPAIKPVALQRVMSIRAHYPDLPIIACGGVSSAEDVLEFILAGADLVQMLSSALIKGRQLYDQIIKDLPRIMDQYDIESIEALRKTSLSLTPQGLGGFPVIDHEQCILCSKCVNICPEIAMMKDGHILNDQDRCIRCGLCESSCPTQAIKGVL